jgi:hypothetical protein
MSLASNDGMSNKGMALDYLLHGQGIKFLSVAENNDIIYTRMIYPPILFARMPEENVLSPVFVEIRERMEDGLKLSS